MRVQLTVNRDGASAGDVVELDDAKARALIRDGLAREAPKSKSKARSTSQTEDTETTEE